MSILSNVIGECEIKTFKGNQRVNSPIVPKFQTKIQNQNIQKGS